MILACALRSRRTGGAELKPRRATRTTSRWAGPIWLAFVKSRGCGSRSCGRPSMVDVVTWCRKDEWTRDRVEQRPGRRGPGAGPALSRAELQRDGEERSCSGSGEARIWTAKSRSSGRRPGSTSPHGALPQRRRLSAVVRRSASPSSFAGLPQQHRDGCRHTDPVGARDFGTVLPPRAEPARFRWSRLVPVL